MMSECKHRFSDLWLLLLSVVCAGLILWGGLYYNQPFLRMLPLFVSLLIGLLQSRASRYAPLLGSMNSLLYLVVYLSFKLYAQAANALLVAFPMQLITFLRWRRHAYGNSTKFRRMQPKHWVFAGAAVGVGFAVVQLLLNAAESDYRVLDNAITVLGLLISVLTMLSFREYSWLMIVNCVLTVWLYVQMLPAYPEQITYLIYAVQSLICIIRQFFSVRRLYAEQRKENFDESDLP